jgi:hypothetical protein
VREAKVPSEPEAYRQLPVPKAALQKHLALDGQVRLTPASTPPNQYRSIIAPAFFDTGRDNL